MPLDDPAAPQLDLLVLLPGDLAVFVLIPLVEGRGHLPVLRGLCARKLAVAVLVQLHEALVFRTLLRGHVPLLEIGLDARGVRHEDAVADVEHEEDDGLDHGDLPRSPVAEEAQEAHEVHEVEDRVAGQRVASELQRPRRSDPARADDEKDVEDCRAHDGGDAHVAGLRAHGAHERGEELRRGAARGHEGGARHVGREPQCVGHAVQRWHEELVTNYVQRDECVEQPEHVQDGPAHPNRLRRLFRVFCLLLGLCRPTEPAGANLLEAPRPDALRRLHRRGPCPGPRPVRGSGCQAEEAARQQHNAGLVGQRGAAALYSRTVPGQHGGCSLREPGTGSAEGGARG
mmetsp:Transcript_26805/g.73704  ORF Transcript_26805/g.73704 Transcript_26805/m.73704 type:complete len:344 (-) Transcript_26805:19-1050(-)